MAKFEFDATPSLGTVTPQPVIVSADTLAEARRLARKLLDDGKCPQCVDKITWTLNSGRPIVRKPPNPVRPSGFPGKPAERNDVKVVEATIKALTQAPFTVVVVEVQEDAGEQSSDIVSVDVSERPDSARAVRRAAR